MPDVAVCQAPPEQMSRDILAWYDRAARRLPWRVPPGSGGAADPYRVWLSEVMLQQTTVAAVKGYFEAFMARWPRVEDLAAAEDGEVMAAWAGLGYYARARNLLACARVVARELGGRFPDTEAALLTLPGVGPYTAAAVAAIAFQRPSVVLDGNVERVMARLHAVDVPLGPAKTRLRELAARLTPQGRPGDYAQAVMDLGATICTPRRPTCGICPWRAACAGRRLGIAAELPRKAVKVAKPVRFGVAYLAVRADGAVLLERRPAHGLLGGMLGLPGAEWASQPIASPPFDADWRDAGGEVRHVFTHFQLRLRVEVTRTPPSIDPRSGGFFGRDEALASAPTVMKKALLLGLAAL